MVEGEEEEEDVVDTTAVEGVEVGLEGGGGEVGGEVTGGVCESFSNALLKFIRRFITICGGGVEVGWGGVGWGGAGFRVELTQAFSL